MTSSHFHTRPLSSLTGALCMCAISGMQYAWTLFVDPMRAAHGWERADIQIAFALFIALQAWLLAGYGYLVDTYGARRIMRLGGLAVAASWTINAAASSLTVLYAGEALAGIGSGLVIAAAYGTAMRTENRRGLIVGLTSAGYGSGAALWFWLTPWAIRTLGYELTFLLAGLSQGLVIIVASRSLPEHPAASAKEYRSASAQPLSTARKSVLFCLLYLMFALVAAGGLMVTAQLAPIAHDYGVASVPLTLFGVTASAIVWAGTFDRITNGCSRPLFGWLSDAIGREATMCLAFLLEAAGVYALVSCAHDPLLFVLLSGVVFFGWGEIFSLFPSLCTDLFGTKRATMNYGVLYTAKGLAALFVPYANTLAEGGEWERVFMLVVCFDVVAAGLAVTVLLLRMRFRRSLRFAL